jgi:hypothetical protein
MIDCPKCGSKRTISIEDYRICLDCSHIYIFESSQDLTEEDAYALEVCREFNL